MSEPFNNLLSGYIPPDRRRRIANALMADQFDRPTPQDGPLTERAGLAPFGIYANGQTGVALPGLIAQPVESFANLFRRGYQGGTGDTQGVEDAFNAAGGAMVGGALSSRPKIPPVARGAVLHYESPQARGLVPEILPPTDQWQTRTAAGNYTGPMTVYHGTSAPTKFERFDRPPWMTDAPAVASGAAYYETPPAIRHIVPENLHFPEGRVFPLEINLRNPFVVKLGEDIDHALKRYGYGGGVDPHRAAAARGHDFFIYSDLGSDFGVKTPHMQIVPLTNNSVRSATTGETLYTNGGRPGVATGALNNLFSGHGYLQSAQPPPADWRRNLRPGDL